MNKEKYFEKKRKLRQEINDLQTQLRSLEETYIESNSEFLVGEKVKVITPEYSFSRADKSTGKTSKKERFAYVNYNKINYLDNVEPILIKEKKDGTPSKIRDYLGRYDVIEKIN